MFNAFTSLPRWSFRRLLLKQSFRKQLALFHRWQREATKGLSKKLPYFTRDFNKIMKPSSRCVHGSHWIREMKGQGEFRILLLNSHFENSLPFFVVGSERRPQFHQNFLIFLETSARSYHHTLSVFVRVIGSEWIREMAGDGGRFEMSSLLQF